MKRFLASILVSLVLIIGYLGISTVIVVMLSESPENLDRSLVSLVDLPLRGPKYVYYYLFPPTAEDFSTNTNDVGLNRAFAAVLIFGANVLLYAIPIYILLVLVARLRNRTVATEGRINPPSPPNC